VACPTSTFDVAAHLAAQSAPDTNKQLKNRSIANGTVITISNQEDAFNTFLKEGVDVRPAGMSTTADVLVVRQICAIFW